MDKPILIFKDGNKYYPMSPGGFGFYILPSELNSIIKDLTEYCNLYTDEEIKMINKEKEDRFFNDYNQGSKKERKRNKGYLYVLKCSNKYKIGFAKNINQRLNQLDTRPFKLELIFQAYSDKAYDIEQQVHQKLKSYNLEGEWYDKFDIENFKILINEIAEDLECDIQY